MGGWFLLAVLSVLVAMGLLAGQQYVTPKFAKLQTAQANYAGHVGVTALFIFVALILAAMVLSVVGEKPNL